MRVKKRIFSGVVCEQVVYTVSDRAGVKGKPILRFKDDEERAAHRIGIARRRHARIFNETFTTNSLYITLTFSDENEIHNFKEARKIRDNFYRRLKYSYPDSIIAIYMGRGKSTHRIHFHAVIDGIPESVIREQWYYGSVEQCEPLRKNNKYKDESGKWVNRGRDWTSLANYLFNHWSPEQGGHYYKISQNARRPVEEEPKEIRRSYSSLRPPQPPKGYELVECTSTRFGFIYFRYIKSVKMQSETANENLSCVPLVYK